MDYEPDSYYGTCAVCGRSGLFVRRHPAIRETYRCPNCRASLRERHQAQAVVDVYGFLWFKSFSRLVHYAPFARMRVYEPGTIGPFRPHLRRLAHYRQSDYYAEPDRDGAPASIPHQDMESLSWADGSFDLVISSDILEHVRHPQAAFDEIARILVPGGYHIFTVPLQDPLRPVSIRRVDTSGAIDVPLLPEHYHGNGKGGRSLVYTDFGEDLLDMIRSTGMEVRYERGRSSSRIANAAVTIVSWRPPARRRGSFASRLLAAALRQPA